jgi:hypothetical protein
MSTTQTEAHSNPRTEQNKFKARNEVHMPHRAREVKVKRNKDTSMHLGKHNQ